MPRARVLGFGPSAITQRELGVIVSLENQIRMLESIRDSLCMEILARLGSGAGVEIGTHRVELRHGTMRRHLTTRIAINGILYIMLLGAASL